MLSIDFFLIKAKTIIYMKFPLNCGTHDGAPNIKITQKVLQYIRQYTYAFKNAIIECSLFKNSKRQNLTIKCDTCVEPKRIFDTPSWAMPKTLLSLYLN